MAKRGTSAAKQERLRRADGARRIAWTAEAGAMIQAARIFAGFSQRQLAEVAHCTPNLINFIEAGERTPSPPMMQAITKVLGLAWYQPPVMIAKYGVLQSTYTGVNEIAGKSVGEYGKRQEQRRTSHRSMVIPLPCPAPLAQAPTVAALPQADRPSPLPSLPGDQHAIETEQSCDPSSPPTSTS
jgi:transcriptional regulator with XRE-family HTH domain